MISEFRKKSNSVLRSDLDNMVFRTIQQVSQTINGFQQIQRCICLTLDWTQSRRIALKYKSIKWNVRCYLLLGGVAHY